MRTGRTTLSLVAGGLLGPSNLDRAARLSCLRGALDEDHAVDAERAGSAELPARARGHGPCRGDVHCARAVAEPRRSHRRAPWTREGGAAAAARPASPVTMTAKRSGCSAAAARARMRAYTSKPSALMPDKPALVPGVDLAGSTLQVNSNRRCSTAHARRLQRTARCPVPALRSSSPACSMPGEHLPLGEPVAVVVAFEHSRDDPAHRAARERTWTTLPLGRENHRVDQLAQHGPEDRDRRRRRATISSFVSLPSIGPAARGCRALRVGAPPPRSRTLRGPPAAALGGTGPALSGARARATLRHRHQPCRPWSTVNGDTRN